MIPFSHRHLAALLAFCFAVLLAGLPGAAIAADECDLATIEGLARANPDEAAGWLAEAQLAGCFGIDTEPPCATGGPSDPVCSSVLAWARSYEEDDEPDLLALCEQADALTAELAAVAESLPPLSTDVMTTRRRLAEWRVDCRRPAGLALAEGRAADWEVDSDLRVFSGRDRIDVVAAVDAACVPDSAPEDLDACIAATRTYFILLDLIGLQHGINSLLLADNLAATVQYIVDLDARWELYFSAGRALLPWEVAANGWLARPARGFNEPPSYQLILLHPSPIVTTSGLSRDDMAAGIALDLVGIYAWRWDGTRMRSPFGLPGPLGDVPLGGALTLTVDGNDDPGLGLTAYLPRNWSVGATVKSNGDVAMLLSVDLAKLLIDPQSQRARLTEAFRPD